jgi:NADP-dependent 3-hydroxy acid dehydrogenase YdfG
MKKFSFDEKTIIVTGASQGIGYEICKYLFENSTSKIIGISRTKSNLDDATNKFNTSRFIPLLLDVSKV